MVYRRAPSVRSLLVFLNMRQHSHELSFSDLLSGLTIAGNFEVPAASPASSSNKREREDSDDESQKSAVIAPQSPNQRNQQQRASPLNAAPAYPTVTTDSNFPRRASMQINATSSSALAPGMPADMYHHHHTPPPRQPPPPPPPAAPKENLNSLLPKSYQNSYIPLGGSSGLGAAVEPTTPPYRTSSSPATTTTTTGYTSPRSPTENMMLTSDIARGQLYDMSTTTPNSPLQPPPPPPTAVDFMFTGTGTGGGPGMEFGGGGYGGGGGGMPVAYKEAMRRQFAPVLQDGQIGVDQDTMMMWSTMPTTYECVIYFSSSN